MSTLLGARAQAARRIVYLGFSGVRGGEATQLVARFLTGRFELVSGARFAHEARRRGLSPATPNGRSVGARAVKAIAVVSGQVARSGGQFVLRVTVFGASNGLPVGNFSFPLRGMRVDPLTARRVATSLLPALARARPGAPVTPAVAVAAVPRQPRPRAVARTAPPHPVAVRPLPPPAPARRRRKQPSFDDGTEPDPGTGQAEDGTGSYPPEEDEPKPVPTYRHTRPRPPAPAVARRSTEGGAEGDSLGFDVGDGSDRGARRRGSEASEERSGGRRQAGRNGEPSAQVRKPAGAREDWEKIFELGLGLMVLNRQFDFNDPIDPKTPRNYRSGMVPAILLDVGLYPLALFGHNALAGLGVVASYYRVPVLRSKVEGSDIDTTLQEWELGLRYRWNMLSRPSSPTLRAGLSVGGLGFEIHYDPTLYGGTFKIPLPNISYLYLKLAIAQLEVPFYTARNFSVGGLIWFDYLHVFNAGPIERTDSGGYGGGTTGGIDLGGGLYGTLSGFFVKVTGFYRRMFFAFDGSCYTGSAGGCNSAGGALDIYQGLALLAGYAY